MMLCTRRPRTREILMALGVYSLLVGWMFWPLLSCLSSCYLDLAAIHGNWGTFEFSDTLLNTWILAWSQHALASQPLNLFEANTFYPASNALAGSEHLLGLAILTWPLRLFTSNAIGIHQFTLVLTCLLLALTSHAFVRHVTRSQGLALLSGACSIFMPWHMAELTRIQLLGAHWFPLIWLLALRITANDSRKNDSALLFVVLTLQLLTSFYLAYSLTLSLGVCIALGMLMRTPRKKLLFQLGLPVLGAYAISALSALPYLSRSAAGQLAITPEATDTNLTDLVIQYWGGLLPSLQTGWSQATDMGYSYSIPLAIVLAALLSLTRLLPLQMRSHAEDLRQRTAVWSLWLIVLTSMVLILGREARAGEFSLSLPADWASAIVPGFANLRAPIRWAIPIGIAAPLLAGIGLDPVRKWLFGRWASRSGRFLAITVSGVWILLFIVTVPWRQLPAKPAHLASEVARAPYEHLASLGAGAVLEFPWHSYGPYYVRRDSEYMAASTIHWKPIVNGFTAYLPPHFNFLRRVASRLPEQEALVHIRRLLDVRWFVVHIDAMRDPERARWRAAARQHDHLRPVYDDGQTLILELARGRDTGIWQSSLVPGVPRETTLTGASRAALLPELQRGKLRVMGPQTIRDPIEPDLGIPISLQLENASRGVWPGIDPESEGLVTLQVAWISENPDRRGSLWIPLDADLGPGEIKRFELNFPDPGGPGRYDLCFGLTQIQNATPVAMPIEPASLHLEVVAPSDDEARAIGDSEGSDSADPRRPSDECRDLLARLSDKPGWDG